MTRFPMLFLVLAVLAGSGAAVCAQDVQAPPAKAPKSQTQNAVRPLIRPGDSNCLRATGSHIPPKPGHCLPVNGRSYTHDELQRTGDTNTADALRMLDPAIH